VCVCARDNQYFYSEYVGEQPPDHSGLEPYNYCQSSITSSHRSNITYYCGPVYPEQWLNPVRCLSYEFIADWPKFAKFLQIISSNVIILSMLFIMASVYTLACCFHLLDYD